MDSGNDSLRSSTFHWEAVADEFGLSVSTSTAPWIAPPPPPGSVNTPAKLACLRSAAKLMVALDWVHVQRCPLLESTTAMETSCSLMVPTLAGPCSGVCQSGARSCSKLL